MSIVAVFFLALFISLFFLPRYKGKDSSYAPLIVFFFVLFLAGLASQHWITPIGPVYWGIPWLPLIFVLLIFTFLFAAPSPWQHSKNNVNGQPSPSTAAISIFFWLLLFLLIIANIIRFYKTMNP